MADTKMKSENNLKRLYDSRYEDSGYMTESTPLESFKTRATLAHLGSDVQDILDYGCGQGSKTEILGQVSPNCTIVGIDISRAAVKTARTCHLEGHFVLFDGSNTPFADESFDLVFSFHVLEHVWNLKETVRDMSRLVRPGRYLCAILPCGNPGSFERKIVDLVGNGCEISVTGETRWFYEDETHMRRLRSREIIDAFEESDFSLMFQKYVFRSWGGVLDVCRAGPIVMNRMFPVRRGKTVLDRAILFVLKPLFLACSTAFLVMSRTISDIIFDRLWVIEWTRDAERDNGAEQYLLFKKNEKRKGV
jgi:SAM-dependent methyltransferase